MIAQPQNLIELDLVSNKTWTKKQFVVVSHKSIQIGANKDKSNTQIHRLYGQHALHFKR